LVLRDRNMKKIDQKNTSKHLCRKVGGVHNATCKMYQILALLVVVGQ
jgi:hypothetical protein